MIHIPMFGKVADREWMGRRVTEDMLLTSRFDASEDRTAASRESA